MNLTVTTEHRFYQTSDGRIWTDGINSYEFWSRYLCVYDRVRVVARVRKTQSRLKDYRPATGPGVAIWPVPDYVGPWQYLARAIEVRRAVRAAVDHNDAVIMRVSSHLAGCLEPMLIRRRQPFGLEVVNDPFDVFAPGAVRYSMRPLFRWWFTRQLRRQCRLAVGVAYVTERALQERYPCAAYSTGLSDLEMSTDTVAPAPAVFTTHYSSVELAREDSFAVRPQRPKTSPRFRLLTVASLAQMYKAPDVLIRAVADCARNGMDITLRIAGDGKHRPGLESLAADLHVSDRVEFLGQLPPGAAVREQFDQSDLFVLPSRCEGLPRAMIEAMARALPCVGSSVGGIPELLEPEDLVPPDDVNALAKKIREVLASPSRLKAMSARNLAKAQGYRDDVLAERRRAFFAHLRRATESWVERSGSPCAMQPARSAEV